MEETDRIKSNKIDIAIDLNGSFLTDKKEKAYETLGKLTLNCVREIFDSEQSNFLALNKVGELDISKGDNLLDSCLQFKVLD